jgi:predicted nucleotidyltransferase
MEEYEQRVILDERDAIPQQLQKLPEHSIQQNKGIGTIYNMDKTIWNNFIGTLKESSTFRNRVRRYTKDRDELLNVGGQKNTPPYTKKMSKHVTFDKMAVDEEIDVDREGFQIHSELNSEFWQDKKMKEEIRQRLLEIANDFIESLPFKVDIKDIVLTGSLANYNWSKYSDVDLHVVVDFDAIDENTELVKGFFDGMRIRWNDLHDITIKDHDVEIYVENIAEEHHSTGIYSIVNDDWVMNPERVSTTIDVETALKKANDIDERIGALEEMYDDAEYDRVMTNVDKLKEKIRNMRSAGLESEKMEYSPENIAFKMLRRSSALEKLTNLKYNAYDKSMTMDD